MKTFISHSSRDKWIARKLSEELVGLDCETFLDEKDIYTGESIDETIHDHLNECDDFLLLLSPDSIKSHWVLIELGGALALKKRIVIILLYLDPNDIPQPISKYLARDINDIEKYYSEVTKRLSQPERALPPKEKPKPKPKPKPRPNFSVGDRVQLISTPQPDTSLKVGWGSDRGMDRYCGITATISEVVDEADAVKIEEDGNEFWWAFDWLTPIS